MALAMLRLGNSQIFEQGNCLKEQRRAKTSNADRWTSALAASGCLGLSLLAVGIGLTILEGFHVFERKAHIDGIITVSLAASFPLLFFAAHCLDKARQGERDSISARQSKDIGNKRPSAQQSAQR
jgi:hypothetical protein